MGRSNDEKGADKAVQIRRSQLKERTRLQSEIQTEQKTISDLNAERAPIAAEVRKVEAEVGPIKYIAKFIYGDHGADENMLEKAVTWIIVLIVVVFDPLAVIMLLAAQMTFGWRNKEQGGVLVDNDGTIVGLQPAPTEESPKSEVQEEEKDKLTDTHEEPIQYQFLDEFHEPDHNVTPVTALGGDITAPEQDRIMIEEEARKYHPEQQLTPEIIRQIETGELTFEANSEIVANIDEVTVSETEESKKKDIHDQRPVREDTGKEQGSITYFQISEQSDESIWSRISRSGVRAKDELYRLHSANAFNELEFNREAEPELAKFIDDTNIRGPKFSNYSPEKIEQFVTKIYELRKNNGNNTP
jgi:hypothetical protein